MLKNVLIFMALLQAATLPAAVVNVPADQATIQAGIMAAGTGDTVLVARGTYYENINFRGRNITVASRYLLTGDLADIDSTVIDGSAPVHPDSASCVLLIGGEDSSAVLCGFTLTRGTGTRWPDEHGAGTYREGGGILVALSSPGIRNNLIIGNSVSGGTGLSGAGGGGIRAGDGNPSILNNVICFNQGADYGGGLVLNFCGGIVRNNIFYRNRGGAAYGGGGIWANDNNSASKTIENNSIVGNQTDGSGGGCNFIYGATAVIRNNIIWGNSAGSNPQLSAGAAASYCDIQGGWGGDGNLGLDPSFADYNSFLLNPPSPCIDAGDSAPEYADPEDPGNPGQAAWPSQGLLRGDIGAYGGPGATPLSRVPTTVTGISPKSGSARVPLSSPMVVSFSGPADTSSIVCNLSDTGLQLSRQWNARGDTLTLNHALPFADLGWYSLAVSGGRDSAGRELVPLPDSARFRATDTVQPRLKSTTPPDGGSDIALNAKIYLKFTKPVSRPSVQFDFSDTSIHFTRAWYPGDTLVMLSHTKQFTGNTVYTLAVTAAADTFGNGFGGGDVPNPFSFNTLANGVETGPGASGSRLRVGSVRPNPARPGRSPGLEIELDKPGFLTVRTYNVLGQLAGPAVDQFAAAGLHNLRLRTTGLAPGLYFVRIRAGAFSATRKFAIIR